MKELSYILTELSNKDTLSEDTVSELEELIARCNRAYAEGNPVVEDSVYDYLKDALQRAIPDSPLLYQTYEETVQDEGDPNGYFSAVGKWGNLLEEHPMYSIQTIKSFDEAELFEFFERVPEGGSNLFFSMKLNGHGIRLVYHNGNLVSATSRARRGRGKDILPKLQNIVPTYMPALADYDEVEIRGELVLPLSNLDKAREYNPGIKSAFSGVSSLLSQDSGDYAKLLKLVAYNIFFPEGDGRVFDTKDEEYDFLEECGFEVPEHLTAEYTAEDLDSPESVIAGTKDVLAYFEELYKDYDIFCDGVVAQVNDNSLFRELGDDGVRKYGNIALKLGAWAQVGYSGRVRQVLFTAGMTKMSPVAIVESLEDGEEGLGVLVAQGNRVSRVPLYEPANVLVLGVRPGSILHFNYGGESAVVPTDEAGRSLKENSAEERLSQYLGENL